MIKIGFMGDDDSATDLVERALKAGYQVTVSSIDATEEELAEARGSLAEGAALSMATAYDCGKNADVVFLTLPYERAARIPAGALTGRIVVDLTVGEPAPRAFVADAALNPAFALQEQTGSHLVWAQEGEEWTLRSDWALAKGVALSVMADMGLQTRDDGELTEAAGADDLAYATARMPQPRKAE